MNYGLNNNTGRPASQANNGLKSLKNGINSAKSLNKLKNFTDGMKSPSSMDRIASVAKLLMES